MAEEKFDLSGDIECNKSVADFEKKSFLPINGNPLAGAAAKQWLLSRKQNMRPWGAFLASNNFRTPPSAAQLTKRVVRNVEYFQSNYMLLFLGLVVYCLITSPLLLIAVAVCLGGCYIVKLKNAENKVKIFGHQLNLAQQYAAICACSVPLFFLAGAGSAVFWIIGASFFVIMAHASFFAIETFREEDSFDATMEII